MIDLYTWKTPNGRKPAIMLEEVGLAYTLKPIDIGAGDQQKPDFLAISPNGKIPAIVDHDAAAGAHELFESHAGKTPLALFESGAILIYLADKSGQLLAASGAARYDAVAWLSWQLGGLGPMLGQLGFFFRQKERNEPALARYAAEAGRLLHVLETRLGQSAYLAGDAYSIADIACYPWVAAAGTMLNEALPEDARGLPATKNWLEAISTRPAVQRGMAILA